MPAWWVVGDPPSGASFPSPCADYQSSAGLRSAYRRLLSWENMERETTSSAGSEAFRPRTHTSDQQPERLTDGASTGCVARLDLRPVLRLTNGDLLIDYMDVLA